MADINIKIGYYRYFDADIYMFGEHNVPTERVCSKLNNFSSSTGNE